MTSHLPFRHGLGRRALLACAVAIAVAGCSIPAKLNRPPVRDDVPLAGLDTGHRAGWPDAAWWKQYNDPQLDQLIELATKDSPDIAQAKSRVDSAQQNIRAATAQAGLSVNGSAQVERQRLSETGLIPPKFLGFTWYNQGDIGVQAQYDFDWWGKKRNTIEAAVDQAHAAEAQHSAAALAIPELAHASPEQDALIFLDSRVMPKKASACSARISGYPAKNLSWSFGGRMAVCTEHSHCHDWNSKKERRAQS